MADLSKYSDSELELIKGIFENKYTVKDSGGRLIATPSESDRKGAAHEIRDIAGNARQ